jgi:hypothetical protein
MSAELLKTHEKLSITPKLYKTLRRLGISRALVKAHWKFSGSEQGGMEIVFFQKDVTRALELLWQCPGYWSFVLERGAPCDRRIIRIEEEYKFETTKISQLNPWRIE